MKQATLKVRCPSILDYRAHNGFPVKGVHKYLKSALFLGPIVGQISYDKW